MADQPSLPPEAIERARRPVALIRPGMEATEVTRDLRYTDAPGDHLRMDVYRPPGLAADDRRPAVVFIHGGGPDGAPFKEMGLFRSMGRLVTTLGFVGVTFTARIGYPDTHLDLAGADVAAALAFVRQEAGGLGIERDRLALLAYSGGGPMLTPFLRDPPPEIRGLAAFYPVLAIEGVAPYAEAETAQALAAWSPIRALAAPGRKPPLYLARAGADAIPGLLEGLDAFVAEALVRDYPLTLANTPGAPHGFDIEEPTPRTLEVLEGALAFLQTHLTERAGGS
jgi:acetyl esterase/lipase